MELTLRSFLLFLRKLEFFFRRRWDQSTRGLWCIFSFVRSCFSSRRSNNSDVIRRSIKSRPARRLWYIFAFFRSRFLSPYPRKRGEICRSVKPRPENPPTTVICASRLPPPLTTIFGGDTPVASPVPISIQVRGPTAIDPEDPLYETQENDNNEHLGVDGYDLERSEPISRSHGHHDENEYTVPQSREDFTSISPVTPSRPASRPPSQYSYRQLQYTGYRSPSQHSHRRSSVSPRRSSSVHSVRPPSITGSVISQVYRASRPTTRARVPSLMSNASRRRGRSPTPTSARHSVHEIPPEVPPLPQSGSRTSVSTHSDPHSVAVSFGPVPNTQGRLRPMIGIDRYEKHKSVFVEDEVKTHIFPPITTQFVRWVLALRSGILCVHSPWLLVILLLNIGFPSCILRELCTGSTRRM